MDTKLASFRNLFSDALSITKKIFFPNLFLTLSILLVGIFSGLVVVLIQSGIISNVIFIVAISVALGLFAIVSILYIILSMIGLFVLAVKGEESLNYRNMRATGREFLWPLFWVGILGQLISSTGYVLLVVPGIAFGVYGVFAKYVAAGEKWKGLDAVVRSIQLVYGRFWSVLLRLLAIIVPALIFMVVLAFVFVALGSVDNVVVLSVLSVILFLVLFYAIIYTYAYTIALFHDLKRVSPVESFAIEDWQKTRKWLKVAAWVGIVATILLNIIDAKLQEQESGDDWYQDFISETL